LNLEATCDIGADDAYLSNDLARINLEIACELHPDSADGETLTTTRRFEKDAG
jgi:hypothetical protein